jgi:succinate dehydrogenase hydrophobic anchor subunit
MWLFMRYSGLALLFLSLSHFWMQHIIIGTHAITVAGTELRWGVSGNPITFEQVIWRVYYAVILILAVGHGINGVRQVAFDYFGHRPAIYNGLMTVIVAVAGLIAFGGILALIIGAQQLGTAAR